MKSGTVVKLAEILANELQYPLDQLYTIESVYMDQKYCLLIGLPYKFPIEGVIEVTDYEPVLQHVKMKITTTTEHIIVGSYVLGTVAPFDLKNVVTISTKDVHTTQEQLGIVHSVTKEIYDTQDVSA